VNPMPRDGAPTRGKQLPRTWGRAAGAQGGAHQGGGVTRRGGAHVLLGRRW